MWETAVKVVPVNLRTQGITEPTPIRAIADYETSTVSHIVHNIPLCHQEISVISRPCPEKRDTVLA